MFLDILLSDFVLMIYYSVDLCPNEGDILMQNYTWYMHKAYKKIVHKFQ